MITKKSKYELQSSIESDLKASQEEIDRHIENVNAGKKSDMKVTTFQSDIDVKSIREKYQMTQEQFSEAFGISLSTLRNWEQERRKPDGPTLFLLKLIEKRPEVVRQLVREERNIIHQHD